MNNYINSQKLRAKKLFIESDKLDDEYSKICKKLDKKEDRAMELYDDDKVTEILEQDKEYTELTKIYDNLIDKITKIDKQLFNIALSILPSNIAKQLKDNESASTRIKAIKILKDRVM